MYCFLIISGVDQEDSELQSSDVDKVDDVVRRVQLQGNSVGQSAANSQGIIRTSIMLYMT